MRKINYIGLLLFGIGLATQSVAVPSLMDCPDMIFTDGWQVDSIPSNGSGGSGPGAHSRTINGNNTYHYYVPSTYQASEALPLMVLWHGAAGAGQANTQALSMRDLWESTAEAQRVIVVAQVSTGASGGWIPGADSVRLQDIIDDLEARYNIETTRRYGWGFSAGGHVMHAIMMANADYFAAYAVSAGVLAAYAQGQGLVPAAASRKIPVFISVGNSDTLRPFALNDHDDFEQAGWVETQNLWFDEFIGGHVLLNDLPDKAWDKICISRNFR